MAKKLKVTRTVTSVQRTPYNDQYYSDMTIEEAIAMESDPNETDWKDYFFDNDGINVKTTVEVIEGD